MPKQLADNAGGCDYLFVSATETVSRLVFEKLAGSLKAVATLWSASIMWIWMRLASTM